MLSSLKVYIGLALSAISGIFLFWFKARGDKIDELEDEITIFVGKEKLEIDKAEVSEEVERDYYETLSKINNQHEEEAANVIKSPNKPLSDEFLNKLRNRQDTGSEANKSP